MPLLLANLVELSLALDRIANMKPDPIEDDSAREPLWLPYEPVDGITYI